MQSGIVSEVTKKADLGQEEKLDPAAEKVELRTSLLQKNTRELENRVLPHVILEQKIEKTYRLYAKTIFRSPKRAKELYDEYLQLYSDYDVQYQKYLSEEDIGDHKSEQKVKVTEGEESQKEK